LKERVEQENRSKVPYLSLDKIKVSRKIFVKKTTEKTTRGQEFPTGSIRGAEEEVKGGYSFSNGVG